MRIYTLFTALFVFLSTFSFATNYVVNSKEEYNKVVENLQPADSITLKNGVWSDFVVRFYGDGTNEMPISLLAETPGKVFLTGESALLISGNYMHVSGLVFTDGRTPKEAVISFRDVETKKVANNSRVTNCKIVDYGLKERWDNDYYVTMWGKQNRLDHNYFGGKKNEGVTLAVYLKGEENWPNYHIIEYNHFGPRSSLGSNGGETIRIGDSHTSLNASYTKVENNLFEECDGEVEIVSIKSSDNIVRSNLFFESSGSLVLRHGNRNQVDGNLFMGNFKPNTGGIRLVNYGHTVTNNLFVALAGDYFSAPVSIMCGLEESPLNRYEPVRDVTIEGNVWLACANGWSIGVPFTRKSDEGEFVVPTDVSIRNNAVWQNHTQPIVNYVTSESELSWENNITNQAIAKNDEFSKEVFDIGENLNVITPKGIKTGLSVKDFYKKSYGPDYNPISGSSILKKTIYVMPGLNTINEAVKKAQGTEEVTLVLFNGYNYPITEPVDLGTKIHITSSAWKAGDKAHPALMSNELRKNLPTISVGAGFDGSSLFVINSMSDITLSGIAIDGRIASNNQSVPYGFITSNKGFFGDYHVRLEGVFAQNFNKKEGAVFKGLKQSFASRIELNHSLVENCENGFEFNQEIEDKGKYNVEEFSLLNTSFRNNKGFLIDLYRGGMDESTFGPFLFIDNCEFMDNKTDAEQQSLIKLTGVQFVRINNSHFHNNKGYSKLMHLKGVKNSFNNSSTDKRDRIRLENEASINNQIFNTKQDDRKALTGLINYPF